MLEPNLNLNSGILAIPIMSPLSIVGAPTMTPMKQTVPLVRCLALQHDRDSVSMEGISQTSVVTEAYYKHVIEIGPVRSIHKPGICNKLSVTTDVFKCVQHDGLTNYLGFACHDCVLDAKQRFSLGH